MPDHLADAFAGLLDELRAAEDKLVHHPDLADDAGRCEVYRWLFSILQVGVQCQVWADPSHPRFVELTGPSLKWGGDNTDATYHHAPIDPTRSYVVRGRRGDSVYLSLTVYGGPRDGRYSERIVGWVNDRELTFDDEGGFELWLSPEPRQGAGIVLEPDAVVAVTRDYLTDPRSQQRTTWRIEAEGEPAPWCEDPARLVAGLKAARTWVRDQTAIVPVVLEGPNTVADPYPVPTATFGWAAGDAAYAMGRFDLDAGQALVVRGRSPGCAFWNLCLWNPLLHTYEAAADRVSINGAQVVPEADGSWTIAVADTDPGHPNWVATQGHAHGLLWFRWFLPDATPQPLTTEVVAIGDVPPGPATAS